MKVSLEFPDAASLTQFDHDYLKAVLIATLYHLGQLSEHEACVVLGVTRRAFEELLPRFGFSVLADDQDTIDVERHA
jgi:Uncharacterised protein family (UPF0175)